MLVLQLFTRGEEKWSHNILSFFRREWSREIIRALSALGTVHFILSHSQDEENGVAL